MNEQKHKQAKTHPVNYVLLALSFIIFGSLGLIFITQMELQPGWVWEDISGENSMETSIIYVDDLSNDGISDIIAYIDIENQDSDNFGDPTDTPNFGNIYALDGLTGRPIWEQIYNNPVKGVFEVMDINEDGYRDFFADIASVVPDWFQPEGDENPRPEIIPNDYSNILLHGSNGSTIPIATGDHRSFTNFRVQDVVYVDDLDDSIPDLIFLECVLRFNTTSEYFYNISSYFVNGTKFDSFYVDGSWISERDVIPALHLFPYGSEEHILFIDKNKIMMFNTSDSNFLNPIFNETTIGYTKDFTLSEDLNGDLIQEIFLITNEGNVSLYSGSDGTLLQTFNVPGGFHEFQIDLLGSNDLDNEALIMISGEIYHSQNLRENQYSFYAITSTTETLFRVFHDVAEGEDELQEMFILGEDLNGDGIDEVIVSDRIRPWYGGNPVARFSITNILENEVLGIINTDFGAREILPLHDINSDSKGDFVLTAHDRIVALASSKPIALWQSPHFPLGLPLFIVLVALLCIGLLLVIWKGRKLSYSRKNIKQHKLTVVVNVFAVALMTVTFLLFMIQLNVFNSTLIPNQNMTTIIISFLVVIITWYGVLPMTAALYNRFAPNFAYTFVKLRSLFFKISKSYNTDILVVDMKDRKEIGTIIQLKRILLPLLLSIAIGFYAYGALTDFLNYPTSFDVFGSTEFFQFMNGYMLYCIFPMILTFLVFSFFISGNFLLDDAGVVYFRQSKRYRQPGDIEPISIWAQSIIKGIAGASAIITLISFLAEVDFSGFFGDSENITSWIFGLLITLVFFVGIPFLTAFSYVLLAGEVMEFSMDFNTQKLYSKMEKKGYDTTPREITNIYPEGFVERKKSLTEDQE
ncbi:MAG: hypothetical protein ACFE96_15275 [Candidatus Hermodarchaeota archaeon]